MPFIATLPLLPLVGAVFLLVLGGMWLAARNTRPNQTAARLVGYTTFAASSDAVQPTRQLDQTSRLGRLVAMAAVTAPQRLRTSTAAELTRAGLSLRPEVFLGIRAVLLIGVPLATGLWVLSSPAPGPVEWILLGMAVLMAPRLPKMWLKRRISANQRAIQKSLPYALDLMVACVEGGLSLEAALAKVAEQSDSLLSRQFRRTLQEMSLGRPNGEALKDLGERTGAADLKRLTESVIQAERMGISIAQSLRTLAEDSRVKRRQRAEETARKAPAKMVPVLIFFILPAMMGVIMTPAVITMSRVFSEFHK